MSRSQSLSPVRTLDLSADVTPHPYEVRHGAEALEEWADAVRRQPFLFDGKVALASDCATVDGHFSARCHLVRFSTFLHWRRRPPAKGAVHVFAMPLIVSGDAAVIAIRMGERTANPGRVYCASGSFDPDDIAGRPARFDVAANMHREVAEETGLDLSAAQADDGFHVLALDGTAVIVRVFRFAAPAGELAARIARHVQADTDPEIEGAVALRPGDAGRSDLARHMPPILSWFFAA